MDEKQYLNRLVNFFGDHHPNVSCNASTIQLKVISRDEQGLPTKIVGTYLFDDSDVKDQVIISFDKGLPYKVSYPDRRNNPDEPANSFGNNGRLIFSAQNNIRIKDLFAVVRSNNDQENEMKRIESLAAVLKEQKKYGSFSCKQCLIEEYGVKEYPYIEQVVDPASVNSPGGLELVDVPKIRYEKFIKLTNTCNITIHVVGVKKRLNAKTGMYYIDNTITLKSKEFVSAEQGSIFVVNPDYYYYSKATSAKEDIEYANMAPDEIVYNKIVSTQKVGKK